MPCQWSSRFPPCCPACPLASVSPPVATPTTPTIGFAGNDTRSFILTIPSRTSNSRVSGACTRWSSCPKPGISVATPHSIGRTSRISATSESPGSAPRTDTGPVALLIRPKSMLGDEIVLAPDLPREAVVRLERDDVAGLDLEHRLEIGAEGPDHLVTREPMTCHSPRAYFLDPDSASHSPASTMPPPATSDSRSGSWSTSTAESTPKTGTSSANDEARAAPISRTPS